MNGPLESAVTIGAFDGVHRGHRAVVERLLAQAAALGVEAVVLTFEPLPREYLHGASAPPRLQPLRDKVRALRALGVQHVRCLKFDAALAAMDAREFVVEVLVEGLAARAVVVGDDFRFGNQRSGDRSLLTELGREFGFEVSAAPTEAVGGARISSTQIRELLGAGQVGAAAALLGRPYSISGRVRRGDALGRRLGVPTANLLPRRRLALAPGSYAARVQRADGGWHAAAAYWGQGKLEAHLLGFAGDLYGERLVVELTRFIRAYEPFEDFEEMKAAVVADVQRIARESRG